MAFIYRKQSVFSGSMCISHIRIGHFLEARVPFKCIFICLTIRVGSDSSWATPNTTHTFFRNIQMWGSGAPSNLTGQQVKSDAHHHGGPMTALTTVVMIATTIVALCI